MSEYTFTRVAKAGGYDIDNVDHIDASKKQITLASEIKTALPGKVFKVSSHELETKVIFDVALDAADTATLNGVVAAHKAIVGTVHEDRLARTAGRENLRATWAGMGSLYPYITGPFEHKFEEVNLLLDEGRNAEAEAVIEFAQAPAGYDATQTTTFAAVKAQMLAGVQGLPIL